MKSYEEARHEFALELVRKYSEENVDEITSREIIKFGEDMSDFGKSFSDKQHTELNRQLANENFRLSEQIKKHEKTIELLKLCSGQDEVLITQLESDLAECHKTIGLMHDEIAKKEKQIALLLIDCDINKKSNIVFRDRVLARESIIATMEEALNKIKDGGVPFGQAANFVHRMCEMYEHAEHALTALKEWKEKNA